MKASDRSLSEAVIVGDTLRIDLWYPRSDDDRVKRIQIGLMDMRAAEDIRISYDFGRNGWMIERQTVFEWPAECTECDPCWAECAFVSAMIYPTSR